MHVCTEDSNVCGLRCSVCNIPPRNINMYLLYVHCTLTCKHPYIRIFLVQKCLKEILSYADVVLSTLTGASNEGVMKYGTVTYILLLLAVCDPLCNIFYCRCLSDDHFDLVVIDECAQVERVSLFVCFQVLCTLAFIINYVIHRLLKLAVGFPY